MIALFGGTFDPVHNGHLHAARSVLAVPGIEQVRMLVSADPPHRRKPVAGAADRHAMLDLACTPIDGVVADDVELRRSGPSYSVDTLRDFRDRYPDKTFVWAIGLDAFLLFTTWYQHRDVLDLANLLVLERPGTRHQFDRDLDVVVRAHRAPRLVDGRTGAILFLQQPMLDVSASDLRQRMASGASTGDLLPEPVRTYIKRHGLYR